MPREAAEALRLTAQDLLRLGIIDAIVPEPVGGAQAAIAAASEPLARGAATEIPGDGPGTGSEPWRRAAPVIDRMPPIPTSRAVHYAAPAER